MPLGQHVKHLTDIIKRDSKVVDDLFWDAMTEEEFNVARKRETMLQHLEDLHNQGEEYYYEF